MRTRRDTFQRYREALEGVPGLEFMPEAPTGSSNRWLTVCLVTPEKFGADRETLRRALEAQNIESRPVWKPMHRQPVFHQARIFGGGVADDLFARGLCLPSGTAMTAAEEARIVAAIRGCHRG